MIKVAERESDRLRPQRWSGIDCNARLMLLTTADNNRHHCKKIYGDCTVDTSYYYYYFVLSLARSSCRHFLSTDTMGDNNK